MRASFRQPGRLALPPLLLLLGLALAACDSPRERAETHYQRGMALLEAGDADRALVEFRNVFRLDGTHIPARLAYARVERERGDLQQAMGQYLRVADQDARNAEAQAAVIEIALQTQDFATAEEHAREASVLLPEDPAIRALKATVDYRHPDTRATAVATAREVLAEAPGNLAAQMVLIADRLNAGAPKEALALADAGLGRAPDDQGLHLVRLAALEAMGDAAGSGEELKRMAALFPDDPGVEKALIQWHMRAGDKDGAEAVLRAAADKAAAKTPPDPQPALTLARFLLEVRGPEAAEQELQARIASAADPRPFQRAQAGLDFAQGRRDAAIAALRKLLEGAEPSDATRDLEVALAQMLAETGAAAESAALVETVLGGDPNNVAALKLRARAEVAADAPDAAIRDMRTALAQAPTDPEVMTITAMAHERAGSRELAGEQLARAVEVSGRAPAESLRYARFLMRDDRIGPAEGVVTDALRQAPDDRDLLQALGQIHLARRDWARAAQVADLLKAQDDPEAKAMGASLESASLRGEGRAADAATALAGLAGDAGSGGGDGGSSPGTMADLVQSYVAAGDPLAARRYLDGVLAGDAGSVPALLLLAGLDQEAGDAAKAEAGYRAAVAAVPTLPQAHLALYGFLAGEGRTDAAKAALDAGLAAAPDAPALVFAQAGLLEKQGDIDGAIAAYEGLYAKDSGSPVLANNLASLITSYRDDAASLERAFTIARRLRGTEVPYFQDTYGWIQHRRGDQDEALRYLAPAAKALPDNALVQFHLAETELALGQRAEARASFERALAAAAAGSPLPQLEAAKGRIAEIDAAIDAGPDGKG
jgi:tetratricopeptide (TPR) repeat protein